MKTPVVLLAEDLAPATVDALGPGVEVRRCAGQDRAALLAAVAEADALLVRSATRVDAEVFAAAPRLRIVARAGVGLDNVDVQAATRAGVTVVNAPTANIVTAAELACGLIISTARNIPQANGALKAGEWQRGKYVGVELAGKTLGVVGLGRIGRLVAERMSAFGMRVVAHDAHVRDQQAARVPAALVSLDELLERADFITVHLPRTPETIGLIGEEELRRVKRSVRIINAARGGIVDEEALATALREGRVAGAGLDVFAVEPCTDSPLFALDNVVVTPHLGASTTEAQDKAGIAVAGAVRRVLAGDLVPEAVNVRGGGVTEEVGLLLPLAENLGRIFGALADDRTPVALHVEVRGEITRHDVSVLELAALKGVVTGLTDRAVTLVNAPLIARERVPAVHFTTGSECAPHGDLVTVRGTFADGTAVGVSGTTAGSGHVQKLAGVGEYEIDLDITDHMLFLQYKDMPGMVGTIGRILGEAGVNIAAMQVARDTEGGEAAVALTVDNVVPAAVVGSISEAIGASSAHFVDLTV
ncbi:phosphoglycerate dehydrogenase [Streptomyces spinoverrucosus]|uniref:phosphoglycerate dehydrogenase n=1 Tax=Streptomyces spinoverrucosus TaxID=284043 RepID=UPI0018C4459B|nr:phosphoglycerate dehydrogenase [Streptomyces spinoverrucosus]MBG0855456.1 phosphoglycerate dehydrogenase [Streptomyces spinoverrucosus]